jgi:tetratricopeptide (TPR) repeat protein
MSLVWAGRNQMGIVPPREAAPKAKEAALKAVALDDTLADAHYALAAIKTWQDWDIPAADAEWKRAIELNPNFPDARGFYSHYLHIVGRREEAMAQIEQALKLDPFNVLLQSLYAMDLLFAGRYEMQQEALAAAKAYYAVYADPGVNQAFDLGYAEGGYAGAARRAAEALAARFSQTYLNPGDVADLYLDAGDKGQALAWLEKGVAARDPNMPYISVYPTYSVLRSDPRFQELLRLMNLPPG